MTQTEKYDALYPKARAVYEEAERLDQVLEDLRASLNEATHPGQTRELLEKALEMRNWSIQLVHDLGEVLAEREPGPDEAERAYWSIVAEYIISTREAAGDVWLDASTKHQELRYPSSLWLGWWYAFRRMIGFPVTPSST